MTMEQIAGGVIALVVMFIGLIGTLIPGIPGSPLIAIAAIGHKFYFKEASLSYTALAIIILLVILSMVLDFLASMLGAKKLGATWKGILGSVIGGVVGIFFSLPGLILGPFIGAMLFEMIGGREAKESARAGTGAMLGLLLGAVGKLGCCVAMIAVFIVSVYWNTIPPKTESTPQLAFQTPVEVFNSFSITH